MDTKRQRAQSAKTQRHWAALAFRDAKYNRSQARRDISLGDFTLAKMHQREAKVAEYWGHKRLRWANSYAKR